MDQLIRGLATQAHNLIALIPGTHKGEGEQWPPPQSWSSDLYTHTCACAGAHTHMNWAPVNSGTTAGDEPIARKWKQPQDPSAAEWPMRTWYLTLRNTTQLWRKRKPWALQTNGTCNPDPERQTPQVHSHLRLSSKASAMINVLTCLLFAIERGHYRKPHQSKWRLWSLVLMDAFTKQLLNPGTIAEERAERL